MLQEAALQFAITVCYNKHTEFKASNGWLSSFRLTYNIQFNCLNGELASEDCKSAQEFIQKYPTFVKITKIETYLMLMKQGYFSVHYLKNL